MDGEREVDDDAVTDDRSVGHAADDFDAALALGEEFDAAGAAVCSHAQRDVVVLVAGADEHAL
mgnify:CR=1 FL=1